MRIVLTGASGDVAQGIIEYTYKTTEHQLVLVDRKPPLQESLIDSPRIKYITADLLDYKKYLEILTEEKAEALIHLAAFPNPWLAHPTEIHNTNVSLSYNALQAASEAKVKRVVLASSVNAIGGFYCFGDPNYAYFPIDEAHPIRPEDAYSLSKAILELQCEAHARYNPDMSIVSMRFHHCTNEPKESKDIGRAARDLWGYALKSSAARACLLALEVPWRGHETVIISAHDHSARGHDAEEIAKKHFPSASRSQGPLKPDQAMYDCSKAERVLGWKHVGGKEPAKS